MIHIREGLGKLWQPILSEFSDIRPGNPSPELRKALGIKNNELPSYVYKMRENGYPPGWLRAARLTHGNIFVFTSVGE
jgi:zinc finger CCHC domain-containing protein 8